MNFACIPPEINTQIIHDQRKHDADEMPDILHQQKISIQTISFTMKKRFSKTLYSSQ